MRSEWTTARAPSRSTTRCATVSGTTRTASTCRSPACTPAFNIELCERFGLLPLDWDGRSDSLYHPFDREGRRHMEYVNERGSFDDMPLARIVEDFASTYPSLTSLASADASFEVDVQREVS